MPFRFRLNFKIAPGLRLNIGKKSIGLSAGTRGARLSTNTRTGTRASFNLLPGISFTQKLGRRRKKQ